MLLIIKNADYTTGQIMDIADKLEEAEDQLGKGGFIGNYELYDTPKSSEDKLFKACKDRFLIEILSLNPIMKTLLICL
jgi:COP9 signalosome complex subunit 5